MSLIPKVLIKIFPANEGDCFLISLENDKNILLDCGYPNTYSNYLKRELLKLQVLDLFVITHYDSDHISGAINLLDENNSEEFLIIKEIWHNSLRHLQGDKKYPSISDSDMKILKQCGFLNNSKNNQTNKISGVQGSTLGAKIIKGKYAWNKDFFENAISIDNKNKDNTNIDLVLLSPNNKKLDLLSRKWKNELTKKGYGGAINSNLIFDDAFEFFIKIQKEELTNSTKQISCNSFTSLLNQTTDLDYSKFEEDTKESNGSSIAFILKYDNCKVLFLADSHPSLIEESLRKLYNQKEFPIIFDAIKVAHHGSMFNTSPALLKVIDSPNFIISTNGKKHNHPDIETLALIVKRETNFTRNIIFNYNCKSAKAINSKDLMERYNYKVCIPQNNLPYKKNNLEIIELKL